MDSSYSIAQIRQLLKDADKDAFEQLKDSLSGDSRKGVIEALQTRQRQLQRIEQEAARIDALYEFQSNLARTHKAHCVVGLDEVGRGPVAGPLCVAGVILDENSRIPYLNDSKQVSPDHRLHACDRILAEARAYSIVYVDPAYIDTYGMTASLIKAFSEALADIERCVPDVDLVLLDGNPLHFDSREHNVIQGDAKCASIAAASIIAKVHRDALMKDYDLVYPHYDFAHNKGYASAQHIKAIRTHGLSPIHRRSFCQGFLEHQESLFD